MQEFDKQAFNLMVFSGVNNVPFGQNVKDYYLDHFKNNAEAWDKFFSNGKWADLDEAARQEREALVKNELEKFDVKRKTFDL